MVRQVGEGEAVAHLWRWNAAFNGKDIAAIRTILHPDLKVQTVFPVGYMDEAVGVEAFLAIIAGLAERFDYFEETLTSIFVTADPGILITEYEARARRTADSYVYENRYIAIIAFREGLMTEFKVYADNLAMRALLESAPGPA